MDAADHPQAVENRLRALETALRKKDFKRAQRLLEALEEETAQLVRSEQAARREAEELRRGQAPLRQRLDKLKDSFRDVVATYRDSQAAFAKFRTAVRLVQMAEGFQDVPDTMEKLRELFDLQAAVLVLDEPEFGEFAQGCADLRRLDDCGEAMQAVFGDERSPGVYIGPVHGLGAPSLMLGERVYFADADVREGSCFLYRLPHKLRSDRSAGWLAFCDTDPGRYTPAKATDYMEMFGDVLAGAVVDMAEQLKAQALREDMERITRHDLKNPLNSILGVPQMLLADDNLTDEQRELLGVMQKAGYIMLDMINLSTDLYRMEKGTYQVSPAAVDLPPLVERALADQRAPVRDKGLHARVSVRGAPAGEAEPFLVSGEKLLCYSMLANLLRNAVEASPSGGEVAVELEEDGGWRAARIRNAGTPPASVRERFFEKYATAGKRGGSGLGTYSARLIAETLGGSVSLRVSDEEEATEVEVRLPAG
jgi:signal transduction histidine kinase